MQGGKKTRACFGGNLEVSEQTSTPFSPLISGWDGMGTDAVVESVMDNFVARVV